MPLVVLILPVMLFLFGGRQTDFANATQGDTGQQRIQLWSQGLVLFRQAPVFGIGANRFADQLGWVAHNSFVHAFTELGLFGGSMYFGAFFIAISNLYRLRDAKCARLDPELNRFRPYLLSAVAGYAVGSLTISRCYVTPTYLILGLPCAFLALVDPGVTPEPRRLNQKLIGKVLFLSIVFLAVTYLYCRLFARWG